MENHSDFLPFEEEFESHLIQKYKEMRDANASYYYDVEEFEELIDYFLFDENQEIVIDIVTLAKSQHPDSATIKLKEAEILVYSENPKLAVEIIETVSLYNDSNPDHYFSKASIYSMADQKEKAIEILHQLIKITENEDRIEAKMALAKEFQEIGDYTGSIAMYQEIITDDTAYEDAIMELSLSCELGGKVEQGITITKNFIDENPYSFFAWFALGNSYLNISDYEKAINAFEYATLINEDFNEAFFNLGNSLMRVERYEEAIEAYGNSITEGFDDPITYNFIGHCFVALEQYESALDNFRIAIEQNPEFADGWMGFAVAYSNLENFREALLYIEKAIKLNPKNMYYQYFHADILYSMGNLDQAEVLYLKVLNSDIKSNGIYLDYTQALIDNKKHQDAIKVLVEGISKFPDVSLLYYRYAALMLQLGNEMDAESILYLALEIDPDQSSQLFEFYPEAENFDGIMDLIENYK